MNSEVVVVIGARGMGQAIGRQQGSRRTVLLADRSETVLAAATEALAAGVRAVATHPLDVFLPRLGPRAPR
jgi:hypothetical protein